MTPCSVRHVLRCALLRTIALAVFGSLASAADWWVDARYGSDSHSGTSPGTPWRSLSHALAAIPANGERHTLHVAPGTYSSAGGESFPILLRSDVAVESEQGPEQTFVVGIPSASVFQRTGSGAPPSTAFEVRGLDVSNGQTAIQLSGSFTSALENVFEDLVLHDNGTGVELDYTLTDLVLRLEGCTLRDNELEGLEAIANGDNFPGTLDLRLVDCNVAGNGASGLGLSVCGDTFVTASLERCRIEANSGVGLLLEEVIGFCGSPTGTFTLDMRDSLVTGNGMGGVDAMALESGALLRSTIADNVGFGLRVDCGLSTCRPVAVRDTILWNNGDDVDLTGTVTLAYCDVEDGDGAGANGNVSVDPLFAAGGYRLSAASPVIDLADPAAARGGVDLDVDPRQLDGDCDGVVRLDMGADEHNLIELQVGGKARPGGSLVATLGGPSGWAYQLRVADATADIPLGPFGSALISPASTVVATGVLPDLVTRDVPRDPALAGETFHLQMIAVAPSLSCGSTSARVSRTVEFGRAPYSPLR